MRGIKELLPRTALAGCMLISAGFMVADHTPVLQSLGVILIFLHPWLNNSWRRIPASMARNPLAIAPIIFYVITALSWFYICNTRDYSRDMSTKLAFILLPAGLAAPNAIRRQDVLLVLKVFAVAVFITGTLSFINYCLHFAEINAQIIHSKPIPIVTGINHIYYSVLLAFVLLALMYLLYTGELGNRFMQRCGWAVLLLMLVYMHTIAARTGLLAFYAGLAGMAVAYVISTRRYVAGLSIVAGMGLLLYLAVHFIPSLKNRFENTATDLSHYRKNEGINNYSISQRFVALHMAANVFRQHPVRGVGPANLEEAMQDEYGAAELYLSPENRIKPHNEFMLTLAALGLIGFCALLAIFILPFFSVRFTAHPLFYIFLLVSFTAFQTESMLERQVGLTFFLLMYMLLPNLGHLAISRIGTVPRLEKVHRHTEVLSA